MVNEADGWEKKNRKKKTRGKIQKYTAVKQHRDKIKKPVDLEQ